MLEPVRILDRPAGDKRVAPGWVAGLRAVDPGIDFKVDDCLERVTAAGPYLPVEDEPNSVLWRAFELPLSQVRVLILGQDPYPSAARAMGLSFSTGPAGDVPDSLANMYEELPAHYPTPGVGDLSAWTAQGVMLLNRALTLPRDRHARPKRHIRWWPPLAVAAMKAIRGEAEARPIAALLWGVPSHGMRKYLEPEVAVFASSHPSPRSVQRTAGTERPFRGSNPFGEVNRWFESRSVKPIDWTIVN
ncbi:uracil-DNA glycosylase [Ornithinimicrobium sp. F0845]|uniref:uracil-DNA glycosylase n=1 Tax=Ornithinimicrobium sp. F0845 TaxID=2926412 RepID=UPI001FF1B272|nr:uracil-DNA glycosylase [Ornithinimicrobium sp. F0845]MCK0111363.1 uracil-DNA glycosylase [Ornithinimicrobium sp. F0845]